MLHAMHAMDAQAGSNGAISSLNVAHHQPPLKHIVEAASCNGTAHIGFSLSNTVGAYLRRVFHMQDDAEQAQAHTHFSHPAASTASHRAVCLADYLLFEVDEEGSLVHGAYYGIAAAIIDAVSVRIGGVLTTKV